MDEHALDAKELIEHVRQDNRAARWLPLTPTGLPDSPTPMQEDESLYYLHHHWMLPDRLGPAVIRGGVKGRVIRLFARLTFRVLAPYLREEREFLARVVRTNDALARRCDELVNAMVQRQFAEAENDAKLAAWLHQALPETSGDKSAGVGPQDEPQVL